MFQSTPLQRGDVVIERVAVPLLLFQSTPLQRGDDPAKNQGGIAIVVSIHAPAKGRRVGYEIREGAYTFQSTPLQRGDPCIQCKPDRSRRFNPRPCKGATCFNCMKNNGILFQSTPLQRGDHCPWPLHHWLSVSIHAPAKGRLHSVFPDCAPQTVSIHAPAKGRPALVAVSKMFLVFQSTPLQRGDICYIDLCYA